MRKIGILTYMQNNYGAILQAYALQRYIRNKSTDDVEVVNFTTADHLKKNKIFRRGKENILFQIFLWLLTAYRYKDLKRKKERMEEFKRENINFSRCYSSTEEILCNPPIKDIYITGSDQVFNPNGKYIDVYYLGFPKGNGKKIAYAPSFGVSSFSSKFKDRISSYILDFDALSCREASGADFISSILGSNVQTVVDPTLLLSKSEWEKVAVSPNCKGEYIFIYDLNGAENLILIARHIKKITNLPIFCLTTKAHKFYKVDKQIYDAGPAEFVGWIANAKYVVTDSFHGTVFSTIFKKDFYSYIAYPQTSSRIKNLLMDLSLSNRIVENNQIATLENITSVDLKVNYSANLSLQLERSYRFIEENIIK